MLCARPARSGSERVGPRPCVVVTRPADQAPAWVSALSARGWPTLALPLVAITEPPDDQGLRHWRAHWPEARALMMVSGAAVRAFCAGPVQVDGAAQAQTRWWAPGPGTAQALYTALPRWGVHTDCIDQPAADAEQYDSEALWSVVAPQVRAGDTVVVVGAGAGRHWLADRCAELGARVAWCDAYARSAPAESADWRLALAVARREGQVWVFSSAQALDHLRSCSEGHDWGLTTALTTHPRIALTAQAMGFGQVWVSRSSLVDVIHTLESKHHDR
jgi:uroporphyrinogen-III synthase